MRILSFLVFTFFYISSFAQETYGLESPGNNLAKKCADCITTLRSMPSEVSMSVRIDEFNRLYFIMTDIDWFNKMFRKNSDGIAVDVLVKADFGCDKKNTIYTTEVSRGTLLPPVYLKEMKEKMKVDPSGFVAIDLGLLPQEFRGEEYELNLLLLNKKTVCHYTYFYNIKRYKWDLLSMGLYTDTILNDQQEEDSLVKNEKTTTSIQYKKLNFTVPFEKNKSNYTKEDISPLYDSMSLNLYDIKRIKIRAYSSVEGSKANNIKLQESRAKSIVDALQTYQAEEIEYDISSSENWLEFYRDIKDTEFTSLGSLSKEEVKKKLENKNFNANMESILSKHRKAVIEIEIEKKTSFTSLSEEEIVTEFQKSIANKDQETAKELMNLAFQRVINKESPDNFLAKLELPQQKEFSLLNNRKTVFQYFLDKDDLLATYNDFLELKKLDPQSKEINYNIVSLKFKLWLSGSQEIKADSFEKEIKALIRYGVSSKLINRMLINFNIIESEINMYKRDYKAKDRNLKSIFMKYKSIDPTSKDLLKLAQYFVAYGKYDWATKLLKPYIGRVDTDEDLLFYYINLTVADEKTVKERNYKKIILNAIDLNESRFCSLFNSALRDGISFQLLDIDVLKKNYCESCQ